MRNVEVMDRAGSRSTLEAIYAMAPVGLAYFDSELRYVSINERLASVNGLPASAHVGRRVGEVLPGPAAEYLEQVLRAVLESGEPIVDLGIRAAPPTSPDEPRDWIANFYPVRNTEGETVGINAVILDLGDPSPRPAGAAAEELFRMLADSAPVMLWVCDSGKLCTYFNRPWLRFTGQLASGRGQPWGIGIHPDDASEARQEFERAFASREPFALEYRLRRNDGQYRWIEDRGLPRYSREGQFEGYIGSCSDITERREMMVALQASEAALAESQRIARVGNWTWDFRTGDLYWSEEMCRMFEVPAGSTLGFDEFMELVHPDDRAGMRSTIVEVIEGPATGWQIDYRFVRKDGEVRHIFGRARIYREEDGTPVRAVGIVQDRTDSRRARLLLEGQNAALERVATGSDLGETLAILAQFVEAQASGVRCTVLRRGDQGRLETWSSRGVEPAMEAALREAFQAIDCLGAEECREPIVVADKAVEGKWSPVSRAAASFGSRAWAGMAILDSEGVPVGVALLWFAEARVPTEHEWNLLYMSTRLASVAIERHSADEALRELNAELERRVEERTALLKDRTDELEAANDDLEAFTYSVSHDLRAPLRAIGGYAALLHQDEQDALSDEGREFLGLIRDNANRMGRMIDDLLAFARLGRQPLAIRKVEMSALVGELARELEASSPGRNIRFELGDLAPCKGDPALLRQAFFNLLSNAVKFTRDRDPAIVRVESIPGRTSKDVVYRIEDNGIGFEAQYADKMFAVFQRLPGAKGFEGTGVGLAIVHRIVQRHRGEVWAEGRPGEGATFFVRLPRAKA